MEFQEYDVVELMTPWPDGNIPIGTRGTILIVYEAEPAMYEVEFGVQPNGESLGVMTISGDFLRRVEGVSPS